jgi:hypothetical protein
MNDKFNLAHKATIPANKISPREVLMMALASVDDFDYAVVVMGKPLEDGSVLTRVNIAAPNTYVSTGMLHHAQQIANE